MRRRSGHPRESQTKGRVSCRCSCLPGYPHFTPSPLTWPPMVAARYPVWLVYSCRFLYKNDITLYFRFCNCYSYIFSGVWVFHCISMLGLGNHYLYSYHHICYEVDVGSMFIHYINCLWLQTYVCYACVYVLGMYVDSVF